MVHVKYAFTDQPPLKAPFDHALKETPETSPACAKPPTTGVPPLYC